MPCFILFSLCSSIPLAWYFLVLTISFVFSRYHLSCTLSTKLKTQPLKNVHKLLFCVCVQSLNKKRSSVGRLFCGSPPVDTFILSSSSPLSVKHEVRIMRSHHIFALLMIHKSFIVCRQTINVEKPKMRARAHTLPTTGCYIVVERKR